MPGELYGQTWGGGGGLLTGSAIHIALTHLVIIEAVQMSSK